MSHCDNETQFSHLNLPQVYGEGDQSGVIKQQNLPQVTLEHLMNFTATLFSVMGSTIRFCYGDFTSLSKNEVKKAVMCIVSFEFWRWRLYFLKTTKI